MPLDSNERDDAMRHLVREMFVRTNQTAQLTTAEVRQLVDVLDDFLELNQAAINLAIPLPLRTKATTSQKALAVAYVAMKRGGLI